MSDLLNDMRPRPGKPGRMDVGGPGGTTMEAATIDAGAKPYSLSPTAFAAFVGGSLNESTPITSMALNVLRAQPSAQLATTWLLVLLVQAVESLTAQLQSAGSTDSSEPELPDPMYFETAADFEHDAPAD